MAKHFSVTYASGLTQEFSRAQWPQAQSVQNYEGTVFFLRGKEVPAAEFYAECGVLADAWLAKKELTHKRVRVLHGSSAGCYVEKWVRK
jgi:hypothetical protein